MDSAMRDLERIRERDDDGEGRPLALVGLLIVVTIALVFAMGSLVGWTDGDAAVEDDPLARLDREAGLAPSAAGEPSGETPVVEARDLRFPEALAPIEERAEVAAARAAAAAELAHLDPLPAPTAEPQLTAILPAAVAAGSGTAHLARVAAQDPMVAASLPPSTARPVAAGHDGEYTVQVISYDSPEGAETFAAGLRARGHRAFVQRADVEGRGTMYRVRVGPFETQREAQAYRREFEASERMNTLLVRRP